MTVSGRGEVAGLREAKWIGAREALREWESGRRGKPPPPEPADFELGAGQSGLAPEKGPLGRPANVLLVDLRDREREGGSAQD
jgi:hypothetical protein